MAVTDLIDNKLFKLDSYNRGYWYHDGPLLRAIPVNISLRGSRFCFEGELHPCTHQGYESNIIKDSKTASFSLSASICDETPFKPYTYTDVELKFITEVPESVMDEYEAAIRDFHSTKEINRVQSERFMEAIAS